VKRLELLHSHDALVLLKNSLAMLKLLYLLKTSNCSASPLLADFDKTLRAGLCNILNVDLNEDSDYRHYCLLRMVDCWHLLPFLPQLPQHTFQEPILPNSI